MKTKLMPLFFVAVLLIASCGAIAAVQTQIVDGAAVSSAQTAPHFAQLNPDFVKYQQGLSAGNALTGAQSGTGFIPPPIDLTQLKGQSIRSALVGAASPPSSYDLRTQGKLTSVKSQGSCGSCWAFAAYASLESYLRPAETMDFSENNMKNTNGFDMGPCGGGDEFMATAYLARWSGPVSETADPYNAGSGSSPANLPVQKHVQDVYYIPDRVSSTDNDNIKTAVMAYGAVYTTMVWDDSSSYYKSSTHAYYDPDTTQVNHAVAIVGWNDNYLASNFVGSPRGNGAWIVKNSFGASWGDNGYFYVSYYDANIGQYNAAFTAQPTTNYNNIYQFDPLGATRPFGEGSASEWGANIFTAKSSENLTAVSFYTLSPNAPYEIYVYTDPTSGPINASGSAAHITGSIALAGYHTVPLASSVSLRAGQKFSVVVKFTSADGFPVPTEAPIGGYSSQARANAGQSYYHSGDSGSLTDNNWKDMTSYSDGANTNICIKAFTANSGATITQPTQLSLSASPTTTPTVGQSVTFTATLTNGATALSGKSVTIYHYFNGVRYNDVTTNTNSAGQIALTQSFGSTGQRTYYATFAGDSGYQTSTSSVTTINVK
jgi:C1A family cysteine protease